MPQWFGQDGDKLLPDVPRRTELALARCNKLGPAQAWHDGPPVSAIEM